MFAIGRQKPGAAGSARAAMHKDAVPGSGRPRSRSPIVMSPVVAGGDTLTQLRRAMRSSVLSSAARSAVDPADKPSALRPGAPLGARAPPTAVSPSAAARPATPPRGGLAPSRAADAASLSAGVRPHSSRSRLASSHRVASSRGRPAAPGVAEAVRTSMGGPPGGALRGGCEAPTAAAPVAAPGAARPDGDAAFFGRLLGIEVPPPGGAPSRPGSSGRRGRGAAAPGRRGVGVGAAAASSGVDDGAAPGLGGADDMLGGAPRTARLETGAVGAADDDEASEFLDIVGGLLAGAAAVPGGGTGGAAGGAPARRPTAVPRPGSARSRPRGGAALTAPPAAHRAPAARQGLDAELAAPFDVSDDDEEAWLGAHSGAAGPGAAAPAAPSAAASGSAGARATGPVHGQTTLSGLARSSSPLRGSIRPKRRQPAASASPAGADPAGTGRAQRAVAVATVGTGAAERAARRKATAGAAGGSRAMVKPGQRIRVTVPSAASLRKRA